MTTKKLFLTFGFAFLFLVLFVIGKSKSSAVDLPVIQTQPIISISPELIVPGDPVLITINSTTTPKEILFDNKNIPFFIYNGKPTALIGIDFNAKVIGHIVKVIFSDGSTGTVPITVIPRKVAERPLAIPDKLGGNTKKALSSLLTNITKDNLILNNVPTATTSLWTKAFLPPLAGELIVTDPYGYNRLIIGSTIVHKGTDFHAPMGTNVMAMNDGVVSVVYDSVVNGNTIVIDHGLGIQTIYLHLSKINVKEGDKVKQGQIIGLSGDTGYVTQPHLHLSIKINKISIDPLVFMDLFK